MLKMPIFLDSSTTNFLKNCRRTICLKYRFYTPVLSILDGLILYNSSEVAKKAAIGLMKIRNCFLSTEGIGLKTKMLSIREIYLRLKPSNLSRVQASESRDFIGKNFMTFYRSHGDKFKKTLVYNLLEYLMKTMEGQHNAKCGERIMDFYMMIKTSSSQAARHIAANLPGPNI